MHWYLLDQFSSKPQLIGGDETKRDQSDPFIRLLGLTIISHMENAKEGEQTILNKEIEYLFKFSHCLNIKHHC